MERSSSMDLRLEIGQMLKRGGATERALRSHRQAGAGSDTREAVSLVLTAAVEATKNVLFDQLGIRLAPATLNKMRDLIAPDVDPRQARDAEGVGRRAGEGKGVGL